jgi:undecaprenyl diphosphate synthase
MAFSGERRRLLVRDVLDALSRESSPNRGMTLSLALSYGGREEIVDAARALAERVQRGELKPEEITEEMFRAGIPSVSNGDPDLLIRTGGELRISNFLLWGSAYSELHFSNTLWPDYEASDLYEAIAAYQRRQRRFGLVPVRASSPLNTHGNGLKQCRTSPTGS